MARQASILIPTSTIGTAGAGNGPSDWVISLASSATSSVSLGKNAIFVINSTQPLGITFGNKNGTLLAPTTSNCYQIPASQQTTFDLGPNNDSIVIINASGTTTSTTCIKVLSVV